MLALKKLGWAIWASIAACIGVLVMITVDVATWIERKIKGDTDNDDREKKK